MQGRSECLAGFIHLLGVDLIEHGYASLTSDYFVRSKAFIQEGKSDRSETVL